MKRQLFLFRMFIVVINEGEILRLLSFYQNTRQGELLRNLLFEFSFCEDFQVAPVH